MVSASREATYDARPYQVDLKEWPGITVVPPGPESDRLHGRAGKIMKGLSGQVRLFPVVFSEGKGCTLTDVDGNRYIDGVSSLWCNVHGHRVKRIDDAIRAQLDKIAHSTLLGLGQTAEARASFERVLEMSPGHAEAQARMRELG